MLSRLTDQMRKVVKRMNLIDTLDVYSLYNNSDDMFLMFNDYILDERVDRDTLNTTIISELGAMRPITTDPDLFKILFDNFFKKYSNNITRLVDTMYLQYNPLHTKDITHALGENEHRESTGNIDNTDSYDTNTDNQESGSSTTENTVSAYDSITYQPKDKSVTTPNTKIDNDVHHEGETTSEIESTVDTEKNLTETTKGKDGDTSYQDLIEKERRIVEFNIYNWIVKQMRKELFLLVY